MKGLALREHSEIRLIDGEGPGRENASSALNKTDTLKQLALKLLMEAQSLNEVPTLDVGNGIDFYEEVKRFEVDLIQSALSFSGGNQVRAARLLNMKVTTLNSKIKHYDINIHVVAGGYIPPVEAAEGAPNRA
jgi:transcriptional regulator with GAF, ATPase, and Fis domain